MGWGAWWWAKPLLQRCSTPWVPGGSGKCKARGKPENGFVQQMDMLDSWKVSRTVDRGDIATHCPRPEGRGRRPEAGRGGGHMLP